MEISRIDQLLSEAGMKIYDGYIDIIRGCLYGRLEQGYSAFEYSCIVASSRIFPLELKEFARAVSRPTNEKLRSTVSRMLNDGDFCMAVKKYFEKDQCEYDDLKMVLHPISTVIERYLSKKQIVKGGNSYEDQPGYRKTNES